MGIFALMIAELHGHHLHGNMSVSPGVEQYDALNEHLGGVTSNQDIDGQ